MGHVVYTHDDMVTLPFKNIKQKITIKDISYIGTAVPPFFYIKKFAKIEKP